MVDKEVFKFLKGAQGGEFEFDEGKGVVVFKAPDGFPRDGSQGGVLCVAFHKGLEGVEIGDAADIETGVVVVDDEMDEFVLIGLTKKMDLIGGSVVVVPRNELKCDHFFFRFV